MKNEKEMTLKNSQVLSEKEKQIPPRLRYNFEFDEITQDDILKSIELSDGTKLESPEFKEKFIAAMKKITGSDDIKVADKIISHLAFGMSSEERKHRFDTVTSLLPSLNPENELEALLLGQYLSLQESGLKCIRNANSAEMFYHREKLFPMAVKLLRCANETVQTLLKVRTGGKQQVIIAHVHGGQAIVANEVSHGASKN